jgi:hypothetical protein
VIGCRGDSIGNHLVEITSGNGNSFYNLDADFCMDSIITIPESKHISDLYVSGVHGRSGIRHMYSEDEINANNVVSEKVQEYGIISIAKNASLKGAIIITN